jgi:hypothetical protein
MVSLARIIMDEVGGQQTPDVVKRIEERIVAEIDAAVRAARGHGEAYRHQHDATRGEGAAYASGWLRAELAGFVGKTVEELGKPLVDEIDPPEVR